MKRPASLLDLFDRLRSKIAVGYPIYYGGRRHRVNLDPTAIVNNALFNAVSGEIHVGAHSFFGHSVSLLTGTHDIQLELAARQKAVPSEGRNIVIGSGVWIASNATILGPVTIGDHAVVCAGAVVTSDVAERTIVGGVPARVIGHV